MFCTENRSLTGLVSFNMQNTESVLREMESCASFVFVILGGWGWGCNSPDFRACKAPSFVYFGSFSVLRLSTLSSLSILLQHNGAGVVKLLQARNQI